MYGNTKIINIKTEYIWRTNRSERPLFWKFCFSSFYIRYQFPVNRISSCRLPQYFLPSVLTVVFCNIILTQIGFEFYHYFCHMFSMYYNNSQLLNILAFSKSQFFNSWFCTLIFIICCWQVTIIAVIKRLSQNSFVPTTGVQSKRFCCLMWQHFACYTLENFTLYSYL